VIEQTFTLTGPADLDVSVPSGSIVIDSGPVGSVAVTVDTAHPDSWRVFQNGNAITVAPERTGFGRGGRGRVRIVAPDGSSLRASTASAEVRARLDLDQLTVATASADVHLSDATSASIKTASGDVSIGTVERDLTVRSASGDVQVVRVNGSASITTASGDSSIETAAGSLVTTSASGDLRVRRYLGGDIEASTMSGDIELGLPSGVSVKLAANTLSGKVHLPEKRKTPLSPDRQVSVRLKSVSGDLRIRRID